MNRLENIYQIAFILVSSVGGAALVIAALSSWLGKVWANRILESDKLKYTQTLDKLRQQFQIKFDQLSIIHENQKNSFQRIIIALHKSIKSLEQEYDEEWHPISNKHYEELKQVVIEESLFLDSEVETALNIYLELFGRAISFPEDSRPRDRQLRTVYVYLIFISEKIRDYFRYRIGLSEKSDPLVDVNLIAACHLVNLYKSKKSNFPKGPEPTLDFDLDKLSPEGLINKVKENRNILKASLSDIISALESDIQEHGYSFRTLLEARYYLASIDEP